MLSSQHVFKTALKGALLCHGKYLYLKLIAFPSVTNRKFCISYNKHISKTFDAIMTFKGSLDRYNGITVSSEHESCNPEEFAQKLQESLKQWTEEDRRGIWFKVNLNSANWVPELAKNGFKFHHALDDFVMMYKWLPTNETCNVPHYAHTTVGVGGVVINDKNQVLVVHEKYYNVPHWKLPGGYVDPGENFVDAAIREVLEETNVMTEFDTVLTFRHGHLGMFGCSDLYTVIGLKPLSEAIQKLDREILDCKWMDLDEYLNHPHVHELNRLFVSKYLEYKKNNVRIECTHGIHPALKRPYTVYHVVKDKL